MSNKRWNQLSKNLGALFIDLGKLAFASLMLGSILKGEIGLFQTFIFGSGIAMISFAAGRWMTSPADE